MKLKIHIGFHKTGSTALQRNLFRANSVLKPQGMLYPRSHVIWDAHHMLPWSLLGRRKQYDGTPTDKIIAAWFAEAASFGAETLIISSEDLEFLGPGQIARLRNALGSMEVDVYAYLRPQCEYLIAEYKQHVRMPDTAFSGSIDQFYYRFQWNSRFNYYFTISRWAEAFGPGRVHVTLYDRHNLVDGDIVADFVKSAGLPRLELPEGSPDTNVSWTNLTALVISRVNGLGFDPENRERLAARLDHIVKQTGLEANLLSSETASALTDCFRDANLKLISEFGIRGDVDRLLEQPSFARRERDDSQAMCDLLLHLVKEDMAN